MRIAIIGPGVMTIPPKSWGAVEIIIWNHQRILEQLGHEVVVYNDPDIAKVVRSINKEPFDFVHLQYDVYTACALKHLKKPFSLTSHYGWLPQVEKWDDTYKKIFKLSLKAPGIIALSKESAQVYKDFGYKGPLSVLRNGVEFDKFHFNEAGNGKAVCIGNIQPRKRQAYLAKALRNEVEIDFYGPNFEGGNHLHQNEVSFLPKGVLDFASADLETDFHENETSKYRGIWEKKDLYKELTRYSCLVLISESENDPLVVKEALAAGVSVVVSKGSAANLDPHPFITVLDEDEVFSPLLVKSIKQAIAKNSEYRLRIRQYAREKFDYPVVVQDYIKIMKKFTAPELRAARTLLPLGALKEA